MKEFVGFLTLAGIGGYFWYQNPQITPWIIGVGGSIFGFLIFIALVCYGFQMLRLFFKI